MSLFRSVFTISHNQQLTDYKSYFNKPLYKKIVAAFSREISPKCCSLRISARIEISARFVYQRSRRNQRSRRISARIEVTMFVQFVQQLL